MSHDASQLQAIHELDGFFAATLQSEGDDTTRTVRHVFLSQFIILAAFQTAIVHPGNLWISFQPFGYFLGVLAMARHTKVQSFQTEVQQECVLRRLDGTEVSHQLGSSLGHIGHLAECLGISQTMIRFVRSSQARELVGVSIPIEVTAVHNHTANRCRMTVHVLGSRMSHDVGTPFKWAAIDRCSKSIVYNQRYSVLVSYTGKLLDIQHVDARVGDGFAEKSLGIRLESLLKFFFRCVDVHEGTFDAELLHGYGKEVECTAVDGRCTNKVVSCLADVENRIEVGCLAG